MSSVVNAYEEACERFNEAYERLLEAKHRAVQAEEEYYLAEANLRRYEDKPGIPKPEYR